MTDIFYMEDDENIARHVGEYLGKYGYRVSVYRTVAEGKEALLFFPCSASETAESDIPTGLRQPLPCHSKPASFPTLALVDWNMPDGTGSGMCRWIRANRKELPIIVLTVRGDSRDIVTQGQSFITIGRSYGK